MLLHSKELSFQIFCGFALYVSLHQKAKSVLFFETSTELCSIGHIQLLLFSQGRTFIFITASTRIHFYNCFQSISACNSQYNTPEVWVVVNFGAERVISYFAHR